MTKFGRVKNLITGLITIAFGIALILYPEIGLQIIVAVLMITVTLRGFQMLWYYFTMARFMVGGKSTLYRGLLYLEAGLVTNILVNYPELVLVLYLAGVNAFAGAVDVLRGRDARKLGASSLSIRSIYGITEILIALTVIITVLLYKTSSVAVYVYSIGIIYSGLLRILTAFRKTAIVYIQ